jgi:glycine/D-amino acid oxidase-like deaminating enzyme
MEFDRMAGSGLDTALDSRIGLRSARQFRREPNTSLWQTVTPSFSGCARLDGGTKTDVAIIGAGFTGLAAALQLRRNGIATIVLEAKEPGWGASGRNSGLVIPTLSRPDPDAIIAKHGEAGERFVALLRDCADSLFQTARSLQLGAQAEQTGWLQPAHTPGRMSLIERRAAQWAKWGAAIEVMDRDRTRRVLGSDAWHGGLFCRDGGIVNPLALVRAMAAAVIGAGGGLYGATPALSVKRCSGSWQIATPSGCVHARGLIVATNAYTAAFTKELMPDVAREIVPVTSWLAATAPLSDALRRDVIPSRVAMSDTRGDLHFARYDADHRLVSGGALINPIARPDRLRTLVSERLARLWPGTKGINVEFVWNGTIGMTLDRFPRFHQFGPDGFAWTGCNGRAVALSLSIGRELAKACMGVPLNEIALPLTPVAPLIAQPVLRWLAPLALLRYRQIDARDY